MIDENSSFKIWLEKEVFPLLLDICIENAPFTLQKIISNESFQSIAQHQNDFTATVEKAIKLRPSKLIILKNFCDDIRRILSHNIFTSELFQDAFNICKKKYINPIITDDLEYFLNETNNEIIPTYEFPHSFFTINEVQKKLAETTNQPKQANKTEQTQSANLTNTPNLKDPTQISIILLSALFGSYKIFNHFMSKSDLLQIKTNISNDLIIYSIIGGNHKIIQTLKRLNLELIKYIDITVIYHRNDICIWLLNQLNERIDINHFIKLAKKELNFELLNQLKQIPKDQIIDLEEEIDIVNEQREESYISDEPNEELNISTEQNEEPNISTEQREEPYISNEPNEELNISAEQNEESSVSNESNNELNKRGGRRLKRRGSKPRNY